MSDNERHTRGRTALLALMIVIVSSLGIVAAACGGGGGDDASPLETFFADVKAVIDDADAEADQVEEGMDSLPPASP